MTHIDEAVERLRNGLGFIGFRAEKLLRQELEALEKKVREEERETTKLIIQVTKDAIANNDSRLASEQGFPVFDEEWGNAINLLSYLEEALTPKKEE